MSSVDSVNTCGCVNKSSCATLFDHIYGAAMILIKARQEKVQLKPLCHLHNCLRYLLAAYHAHLGEWSHLQLILHSLPLPLTDEKKLLEIRELFQVRNNQKLCPSQDDPSKFLTDAFLCHVYSLAIQHFGLNLPAFHFPRIFCICRSMADASFTPHTFYAFSFMIQMAVGSCPMKSS